jgi:hypothetical protein
MPPLKTAPQLIETATRRAFVMKLRLSGASYREIADVTIRQFGADNLPLNYDYRQAFQDVWRELQKINEERRESREELVRLELERLDRMLLAIWNQITSGSFGAIDRGLKISERRSTMLGLNQPTQIAPVKPDGTPMLDVPELIDLIRRADELVAKSLGKVPDEWSASSADAPPEPPAEVHV